jgi:hypothetical protein
VVPHVFAQRIGVHIALVAVQAGEGFVRRVNLGMAHQGPLVDKRFSANIAPANIKEISIHRAFEGFVRRVNLGMAHQGLLVNKRFSANITPGKKLKELASTQVNHRMTHQGAFIHKRFSANIAPV